MSDVFASAWFYWAVGIAIGLPLGMVLLTEWQHALRRRNSVLAKPVTLLRNYLLPLVALLLLMVEASQVPAGSTSVRMIGTLVAFVVLVLLLSGVNAALFQGAPEGSWRKRIPGIFLDVARFLLIAVGLAMIFAYIWGANVKGLFTALGITSIVVGLTLQNSVGQIISGLLMLFEQPFKIGDWLDTPAARGRVIEVNWRAVHLETGTGLQITPNSVLAGASFANLSRPAGKHTITVTSVFSVDDAPDEVCAMLVRVAAELPQCHPDRTPTAVPLGAKEFQTTIPLRTPADDGKAKATFLRWIWYSARRAGLSLDEADDQFTTPDRVAAAIRSVVASPLRLDRDEQQRLVEHATMERYGDGELIQRSGEVPTGIKFILSGEVTMTAAAEDGTEVVIGSHERGSFLGQSTLTRQPVIGWSYAVGEVTMVCIEREQVEAIVSDNPLLLQEFGRTIEQRRANVLRAVAASGSNDHSGT
ncbi:mechanosensitive ion channel family protein [Mycobacterium sp. CVI_P3]|uniref:Mechanosensitive ion channel family protein n=1 Tax=Mycobacterium pinniadriaticum TaxID=2994102 RepID=A0ABT3SLT1_9MYCO|nr:mechanosensitive ion channel family protein [Mycobacterium pinniadriaticum]MCX2934018.1 mechanosensitive ion channel family protein [Mycobacterium pinniadriaticum]MCX2940485.1 mechanosensitive ion channel family protein [Mycobacterium pinniadriaticum]